MMEDGKRRKDMEGLQNMKASHDFFPLSSDAMWQDASILEAGLLQANTQIPMQPPFSQRKRQFFHCNFGCGTAVSWLQWQLAVVFGQLLWTPPCEGYSEKNTSATDNFTQQIHLSKQQRQISM